MNSSSTVTLSLKSIHNLLELSQSSTNITEKKYHATTLSYYYTIIMLCITTQSIHSLMESISTSRLLLNPHRSDMEYENRKKQKNNKNNKNRTDWIQTEIKQARKKSDKQKLIRMNIARQSSWWQRVQLVSPSSLAPPLTPRH